jgi:hypothetical protein
MFQFTEPTDELRMAETWKNEPAFDIYWKSGGLSANTHWMVNSSCDEWVGFRSEIVPTVEDENDALGWRYDHENQYEEMIWLRKDELLQFIMCASLCERLKVIVRTNRFQFAMDREMGEFCQVIREARTGYEIYMADRGDMLTLWAFLASDFDPDAADAMKSKAASGEFRSRYGFSTTQYSLVVQPDGILGTYVFCTKCNTIQEKDELDYVAVEGMCYDCKRAAENA